MPEQIEIRQSLLAVLQGDLIGPMAEGEVLPQRPSRWYLTGFLMPRRAPEETRVDPTATEELSSGVDGDEDDSQDEPPPPVSRPFLPSSMGLSFIVPAGTFRVAATARWAQYEQLSEEETLALKDPEEYANRSESAADEEGEDEGVRFRYWRRLAPREVSLDVPVVMGTAPVEVARDVRLHVAVRPARGDGLPEGARTVSLFLVNERGALNGIEAEANALFQAQLEVACEAGFHPREVRSRSDDLDDRRNDLQYRDRHEWAVGHGVATHNVQERDGTVSRVGTTWIPTARVYRMAATTVPGVTLSMEALADAPDSGALRAGLSPIISAYRQWIAEQRGRIPGLTSHRRRETATALLDRADAALLRLEDGIALLGESPEALMAFQLANRAMAIAARRARDYADGEGPEWYLFQLAFVLLNLRGIFDPTHPDREAVELLFFPTGGGKTEAYLGVAAFTILLRRLRWREEAHQGAGVTVLLRYTLRLLTLDQLGRAATLICALEKLREADPGRLGDRRLSAGLWVGSAATANRLADAQEAQRKHRASAVRFAPPVPLVGCPWCKAPFEPDCFAFQPPRGEPTAMRVGCANLDCDFCFDERPDGIPVVVVDEQIYRELPTLLIATVDKLAMLPWRGEAGGLFGRVQAMDSESFYSWGALSVPRGARPIAPLPPPELIIQDELHLITGPLGTMVGLYETAVDALSRGPGGRPAKILASTATARRASEQIRALYGRPHAHTFPPQALDEGDTFFSRTDAREEKARTYAGVAAPGRSPKRVMAHIYSSLLAAGYRWWLGDHSPRSTKPVGLHNPADTYMTLVGYFNSLKELGGAQRLVLEEVRPRVSHMERRRPVGPEGSAWYRNRLLGFDVLELTSRQSTGQIREAKAQLEGAYGSEVGGRNDVLLASSMISVGVDIDRLGLMVVAGQPRTVAEYIQATSRVGRRSPGLVVTLYNTFKPRDRSHYERFGAFHESFYRFVEASTVTPFSPKALDRGLAGLTTALIRHTRRGLSPREGVERLARAEGIEAEVAAIIAGRALAHREGAPDRLSEHIRERIGGLIYDWAEIVAQVGEAARPMQYSPFEKRGGAVALLSSAIAPPAPWPKNLDRFHAPTSMRDVEPSVHLWLGRTGGEEEA